MVWCHSMQHSSTTCFRVGYSMPFVLTPDNTWQYSLTLTKSPPNIETNLYITAFGRSTFQGLHVSPRPLIYVCRCEAKMMIWSCQEKRGQARETMRGPIGDNEDLLDDVCVSRAPAYGLNKSFSGGLLIVIPNFVRPSVKPD